MPPFTPYPDLNAILFELTSGVTEVLRSEFIGAYLQGSFAIGGFDEHSDVDFIVVTKGELKESQAERLNSLHQRLFKLECSWAKHLEGSYFPAELVRDYRKSGRKLWFLNHGDQNLVRSEHCNTVVVRWTLRKKGVVLQGPAPASLIDPIPVKALRRDMLNEINDWGKEIVNNQERFNNRFYQSFIVLSYCRMLHEFQKGDVGSKREGAEWAKQHLDDSWVDLIDRAWIGRPDPAVSVREPAVEGDFRRTLQFLKEVTQLANKLDMS